MIKLYVLHLYTIYIIYLYAYYRGNINIKHYILTSSRYNIEYAKYARNIRSQTHSSALQNIRAVIRIQCIVKCNTYSSILDVGFIFIATFVSSIS